MMNIGDAARQSGISAKMIRYYESIGLVEPAERTHANYRLYTEREIHRLRFVKRARTLGFSLEETERLLALWDDDSRASSEVRQLAKQHIATLNDRIAEMQGMVETLTTLVDCCRGDKRPDCPILKDLAGEDA